MNLTDIPYKFQYKWGQNAAGGFVTTPIPPTTTSPAASQSLGFPPATSVPLAGGGTPPNINDFNGAYQYVTSWAQWQQAGGPIQYDATFSTNVTGYPLGAVLASTTVAGRKWRSTVDANTSNPDAGGANWVIENSGRLLAVQVFTANGTYTPTPGMNFAIIEVQGGGAGAAGAGGATGGNVSLGAPGTSGSYAVGLFTAAAIGASQSVTVGIGGAGGAGSAGGDGGTTQVGSLIIAPGGKGPATLTNQAPPSISGNGNNSPVATGGNIFSSQGSASSPTLAVSAAITSAGAGGQSVFGPGGFGVAVNTNGASAVNPGAGGGGCAVNAGGGTATGGAGFRGITIIREYS